MSSAQSGRAFWALTAAAVAAILLASCATEPAPPPPPPAPPPVPSVSLAPRVLEAASAYRVYVERAGSISPAFTDASSVAEGVRIGAAYEPRQMLSGAIAYGAVAALQEPAFVTGVRAFATDPVQRRTVAYEIMKSPAYVLGFPGAAEAASLVVQALGDDGRRLLEQGKRVKQAAYDVQRSPWSKADVAGRPERLALAKQLSATPLAGDLAETARLRQAVTGAQPISLVPQSARPPYTQTVVRSLAVAALAALGYADDASLDQLTPILAEPASASCLKMSKLNLYQCLAVSKPHYEDVFCLGQHVLMDTGQCVMKSVGVAPPPPPKPTPVAAAQPVKKPPPRKR